jgi:transketolase
MSDAELEQLGINVIRGLAMDGPQKANSGHPGTAMALAPLAHVLFTKVMNHDPSDPEWPDRDRFILSCGHASILIYSMLYLTGYGLTLDDIKAFRQWGSLTPGHPEAGHTKGVEVTTGPLGQGIGNAVGMAMAERWLRDRFGSDVFDHYVYAICSDGDLQEGISHEAASLAGHQGLGRLIVIFDDNHITIDGTTELSCSDDVAMRFRSYGWDVDEVGEIANDVAALEKALLRAKSVTDKPTLIVLRSHIGYPSPSKTDTSSAHGDPLGPDEIRATKAIMGLPVDQDFYVPDEVLAMYRDAIATGQKKSAVWRERLAASSKDRAELEACLAGRGLAGWDAKLPKFPVGTKVATRAALATCLNAVVDLIPGLVAGGADLTGNTGVALKGADRISPEHPGGRQVAYGIREHAMGAVMNGMAQHGGILPIGGTFFIFSDYMRPSARLAALTNTHVIYSWTHDSIGLGEDGPTHQPVEHLAAMRAMPNLRVIRPADANEVAVALKVAVEASGPTALVLSRQALPVLEEIVDRAEQLAKGAYEVRAAEGRADITLIGTGSEVSLCLEAAALLAAEGIQARVVSMPSFELFEAQDPSYKSMVLPVGVPRLAVEAAATFGWDRYSDAVVGLDRFGSSAPGPVNMDKLGFNPANVVASAKALLGRA